MQIPYDLEFVQNRPTVVVQAGALRDPRPTWRRERPHSEQDAFDALLRWAHRMLHRFDGNR